MTTPTPERSVEEIVEEFKEMSQTFVKAGWDETNNLAYKQFETNWTEEQLDWLTQALQAERQKREEIVGRAIDMSICISGMPEHIATQMAEQMKTLFITQPNNK